MFISLYRVVTLGTRDLRLTFLKFNPTIKLKFVKKKNKHKAIKGEKEDRSYPFAMTPAKRLVTKAATKHQKVSMGKNTNTADLKRGARGRLAPI